ncbi:MAG TPA: polyprenyl synthetase family protein [Spongiibacteraceae bacterium]|nr:polyprenyl synthetase family protein [Spongiibacteraceae bacterium]
MQAIQKLVASAFARADRIIVEHLRSDVGLVEDIGRHIVNAGGKRLRPMVVLLSAGALGAIDERQVKLAAVIEFIHTATLLHDDVVDLSHLRRGRPTANATWGNAPSVLVGDFLYTRAFQLMVALGDLSLLALLADTTNAIAEGEVLQLARIGDSSQSIDDYYQVIERKTAVLFGAAAKGSAILAGADRTTQDSLYRYACELGTAFQIIDDVLDFSGDAQQMGKNLGDDLAEGKFTLPILHALQHTTGDDAQRLRDIITTKDRSRTRELVDILNRSGSLDYARNQANLHAERARQQLEQLPASDFQAALERLTRLAVERSH